MPSERVLQPRTNRLAASKKSKAQNEYFLNDDVDTQQWSENIDRDPALPPSTARIRDWANERQAKKQRLHDEAEVERIAQEEEDYLNSIHPDVPISPELYAADPIVTAPSPSVLPEDLSVSLEDQLEDTLNHPDYPHDLDTSREEELDEVLIFGSLAAAEQVAGIGSEIERSAKRVVRGAGEVDLDEVERAQVELQQQITTLEKSIQRLRRNTSAVGRAQLSRNT